MGRTTQPTSKRSILYIYATNKGTEYFKYALYSPFFPLQNAVCFIMLTCLVPVLFTFYTQGVLKLKKNNFGAKELISPSGKFTKVCIRDMQLEKYILHFWVKGCKFCNSYQQFCMFP